MKSIITILTAVRIKLYLQDLFPNHSHTCNCALEKLGKVDSRILVNKISREVAEFLHKNKLKFDPDGLRLAHLIHSYVILNNKPLEPICVYQLELNHYFRNGFFRSFYIEG